MNYPRKEFNTVMSSVILLLVIMVPRSVFGHEESAPFSSAIIEPLKVHHAHIEDEQRINFSYFDGFREEDGRKRTAFSNTVELANHWTGEFRIGSEVVIPFSNTGFDKNEYNIGDIEFWPIKYSFINEPETILTGVLSLGLPTGSESKGFGEGNTALGGFFFFDHAYRNWFFGVNTEVATNITGKSGTEFEIATVISYSFIRETGDGMAPPRPMQPIVPAVSLEVLSESILSGEDKGENFVNLLPGFHLWHTKSGWQARIGVEVPVGSDRENDLAVLLQFGNHFDWRGLFKK